MSQITLRLVQRSNEKDEDESHTIAKMTGPTLQTLQRCLVCFPFLWFVGLQSWLTTSDSQYTPTELVLRSNDGAANKIKVSLRFIPVKMKLDPRESINNSGTLRVDVLDAADLPSADRNGYSDPYCKFKLAGKEVYKTKVQKKTLHPAWNEFFETPVKSRIGADFRVDVYDWDFGDKADYLGGAPIDLEQLEPFQLKEFSFPLDGKSGAIRLKLLFKPSYVTRSRQGSSTFSGTFATPGKIVGAPVKGVGMVGGGVVRGATFLGRGIVSRFRTHDEEEPAATTTPPSGTKEASPPRTPNPKPEGLQRSPALLVDGATPAAAAVAAAAAGASTPESLQRHHSRTRSVASQFGGDKGGDLGIATFTILSATGFPASAHVRVIVKVLGPKGAKDVHKTKAIKSGSGSVQFDASHETFRVRDVPADAQFQLRVVDHSTFGSDSVLGETLFFVDDQGSVAGREKTITVGDGQVTLKSSFLPSDAASVRPGTAYSANGDAAEGSETPERKPRRSFLSKRSASTNQG